MKDPKIPKPKPYLSTWETNQRYKSRKILSFNPQKVFAGFVAIVELFTLKKIYKKYWTPSN